MDNRNFKVAARRMKMTDKIIWSTGLENAMVELGLKFGYKPESRTIALTVVFSNVLKGMGKGKERLDVSFLAAKICTIMMDNPKLVYSSAMGLINPKRNRVLLPKDCYDLVNEYLSSRESEKNSPNIFTAVLGKNKDRDIWE